MDGKYTIGQLAKRCKVGVETIRFYERRKVIAQPKKSGAIRYYDEAHADQVSFVKKAQKVGFTLAEVKELLQLNISPSGDCAPVKRKTQMKIAEIEGRIADLKNILRALRSFESKCDAHETVAKCSILDGLRSL